MLYISVYSIHNNIGDSPRNLPVPTVVEDSLLGDELVAIHHFPQYEVHPVFYAALCIYYITEIHYLHDKIKQY